MGQITQDANSVFNMQGIDADADGRILNQTSSLPPLTLRARTQHGCS